MTILKKPHWFPEFMRGLARTVRNDPFTFALMACAVVLSAWISPASAIAWGVAVMNYTVAMWFRDEASEAWERVAELQNAELERQMQERTL